VHDDDDEDVSVRVVGGQRVEAFSLAGSTELHTLAIVQSVPFFSFEIDIKIIVENPEKKEREVRHHLVSNRKAIERVLLAVFHAGCGYVYCELNPTPCCFYCIVCVS